MHRLLRTQQPNNQKLLHATFNWQVTQLTKLCQAFYSAGPNKRISLNENSER